MVIRGFVKTVRGFKCTDGRKRQTVAQEHKGDIELLYCGGLSLPERQKLDALHFRAICQPPHFLY
jgi:hypothetical protein